MKGKKTSSSRNAKREIRFSSQKGDNLQSQLATPRDKTWVRPARSVKSEQAYGQQQQQMVYKWVQAVHEGMSVTPDPIRPSSTALSNPENLPNSYSSHFTMASRQLPNLSQTSPLPPI